MHGLYLCWHAGQSIKGIIALFADLARPVDVSNQAVVNLPLFWDATITLLGRYAFIAGKALFYAISSDLTIKASFDLTFHARLSGALERVPWTALVADRYLFASYDVDRARITCFFWDTVPHNLVFA